jgi:tetratricopeptide (TPR) repeat protein
MDDSGYAYLVMEFIDGYNLQEIARVLDPPFIGLALEVACQSLDALEYLHRKRIIHRDVSPDNLLVTRDDEGALLVKLIDLGIAKIREGDENLTSAGTFVGKVRYSSPEHFHTREGQEVSARSDLYSLGVVLYELLTGRYPIKGSNIASLIAGHMVHPPLPFADSDPDGVIPEGLRSAVLRTLEKNPEDRYPSARALREALEPILAEHPLEDEQVQAIFEIPSLPTKKFQTVKPGSTQSRIDRSFGLSTTPAPGAPPETQPDFETSGTVETAEPRPQAEGQSDEILQAQLRALLLGAGKLVEAHHYDEARLQLETVFSLDPGNAEASALLEAVDAADVKLQKKLKEIVSAASEVTRHLDRRNPDEAERALNLATKLFGKEDAFAGFSERIDQLRHDLLAEKVEKLCSTAARHIGDSEYGEAISVLEDALALAPHDRETADLLETARNGLRAHEEARRRQAAIDKVAGAVERLIGAGRLESAKSSIELAVEELGQFDEASALTARIAKELGEREALEARARAVVNTAEELAADNRFTEAETALADALELEEEYPEVLEMIARARREVQKRIEDHRRAVAIREVTESIGRHLEGGDIGEARRELQVAERLYGRVASFVELAQRIDQRERELLHEEIDGLVHKALEHDRKFDDIIADLEPLLERDPEHPTVLRVLAETRAARQTVEEERRREQIQLALDEVDTLIAAGDIQKALATIDEAVGRLGTFAEATALRRRLAKLAASGT